MGFRIIAVALLALLSLSSRGALAESQEMSAARVRQSKSYQEYYDRLRAGGAQSEAKQKEAYDATIAPTQKDLAAAVRNEQRIASKNAYRHNRVRVEPQTARNSPPVKDSLSSDQAPIAPAATAAESYRPETALDGSGVPREIEFPGPKKK